MSSSAELLVSLCMIVKDEKSVLDSCLRSVQSVADEMIVIDTGSTDSTPDIARSFGARVIKHPWQSDFSEARNLSLDSANGKWILVLDADEMLTETSRKELRETISKTEADALSLVIRNPAMPGDLQAYSEFHLTRLFRNNGRYRYEGMIHEQIRPSIEKAGGVVEMSDLVIYHQGYGMETAQGGESRAKRNLEMLEESLKKTPDDPYLLYQLGATYKQTGRDAEAAEVLKKAEHEDAGQILLAETRTLLYMKLGQLALAGDDYSAAVKYAKKCLVIESQNLIGLYVIGVALLYQHKIKEAGTYLLQARNHPQLREEEKEQLDQLISFCGHR